MKGRDTKELEELKSLSLKMQEATSKKCDHLKKGKQYVRRISYIPTRGIYLEKVPLLLILQMFQLFSVMFQFQFCR